MKLEGVLAKAADLTGSEFGEALNNASDSTLAHRGEMVPELIPVEERLRRARSAIENKAFAEAAILLNPSLLACETPIETAIEWAESLAHIPPHNLADALFDDLLRANPGHRKLHFTYARRLNARGLLVRAGEAILASGISEKALALNGFAMTVLQLLKVLVSREGRKIGGDEDCRVLAMKHAILFYRERSVRNLLPDRIGQLTFVTGSLGPGGAERQLSRAAAEIETLRCRDGHINGVTIDRQVEVVVRSHGPEQQHDFYLSDLVAADVKLTQINIMLPALVADLGFEDPDLVILLGFLPAKVAFGLRRLVPHFRQTNPEIVSIWQDGACLFAGLAAVAAGVPRIQLFIRGLPPVIRRHMHQPEYEEMYRALAEVPGVQFVSNSKAAAVAYAQWLDLPPERFSIVYNGVARMECAGQPDLEAQWQAFLKRTADATHAVGGVFRFDTDKRPLDWIRFAARYIREHVDARFVLVGAGRLLDDAVALAEELKIADRLLFVGRSTAVGFWMKRMDVLVLMSRYEGLPNVLIEAQYLGVPVVSTPAGGASECFIEGVTGHILGCAEKPDLGEACEKVAALRGRAQDPAIFEPVSRDFLDRHFSVAGMIENFVRVACGAAA
jgi:Vi polysaccharide biosynthesis protein TviE